MAEESPSFDLLASKAELVRLSPSRRGAWVHEEAGRRGRDASESCNLVDI